MWRHIVDKYNKIKEINVPQQAEGFIVPEIPLTLFVKFRVNVVADDFLASKKDVEDIQPPEIIQIGGIFA
jgi:hypothetical protein